MAHARKGTWVANVLLVLVFIVKAQCDCRLGLLKPAAAAWTVTERTLVYSILPDIIPPSDKTVRSQSAVRPSEAQLILETRPSMPPGTLSRLCIRSASPVAAACAAGKPSPAVDALPLTDPQSLVFNASEGSPIGPCLQLSADSAAAVLTVERPHPDECWPGGGYCTDRTSVWRLMTDTTNGKHTIYLNVTRVVSTYQDTDGRSTTWTAILPYQVVQGCALKVASAGIAATAAAADPAATFCTSCAGKAVSISNVPSSASCVRCPIRSSKSKEAVALVGGSPWKCVPGMPKGFETVAVRMGAGGHPECASTNGKNCLRNLPSAKTCQEMLPLLNKSPSTVALKPLPCGAAHAAQWPGVTGYNVAGHWCLVSREWLQDRQPSVQGKCVVKP